ncbi:C2H2 finger domain-containing protein [Xylaria flabelliformis]|nr:C2H2 finger domain-containing protein [Xylaria flabelliformis]
MSSSMYTISPASLHDLSDHTNNCIQPRHIDSHPKHPHHGPVTPESNLLSPYSSHAHSNSASPTLNSNTPADTISTAECCPPSELFASGEFADDPFLGADFDDVQEDWFVAVQVPDDINHHTVYPLSPRPTPAIPAHQTFGLNKQATIGIQDSGLNKDCLPQQEPSIDSVDSSQSDPQLTPDTNRGSWSSNESPAQAALAMATQSPRVTVSMWGKEDAPPVQGVERSFSGAESPRTVRPSHSIAGDLAGERLYENPAHVARDAHGGWMANDSTGHRGLAPGERSSEEVTSPNQQAARREREEKNREVDAWLSQSTGNIGETPDNGGQGSGPKSANVLEDSHDNIPAGEVPLGDTTENRHIEGQTYFVVDGLGGPITETDFDLMRHLRTWGDAPTIHAIQSGDRRYQPETSQAAIERFYRQCQDNASIVSKAATWGTRRRSLPSVVDMEGITSGNFLKKLSIGGHSRRPSILQRVTSMSRKTSITGYRKRKGSSASEQPPEEFGDPVDRRESKDSLAPPSRTSSWGLVKKPTPSLNTALVGMATSAAAIGTQHARSGSISATPITSPKSPFGSLAVPQSLRRQRSKTELPKPSNAGNSHPNLVGMLRKQGGPPVARLAQSHPQPDLEDEDEDDDDGMDETDFKVEQGKKKVIEPTLNGFRAHILDTNRCLATTDGADNPNGYLVDRIAYQLNNRYKQLLTAKQKHISHINQRDCPSGAFCRSLGGTVRYLDNRGGDRGVDQLSARALSSDEEIAPLEGSINAESFPPGINQPPAISLPAEFECPICFTVKKFQKPSDWTKHVHEDVQPFTCTWDRCRDPKMFKRKADWVRHENEGHRHLEWWTCDVEDCRHVCYRRDNFLQHLVREHKFTEPKVKTKAAIKKAGGVDRTWAKVEQCHEETKKKPTEEPCRFCGKIFPTWKKLTVHLAKHMEQISLPIVDLVKAKELDPDTIISPVQDPPPRHFGIPPPPTTPPIKADPQELSPQVPQVNVNMNNYCATNTLGFSPIPQASIRSAYYAQQQTGQSYHDMSSQASGMMIQPQYNTQQQYTGLPVTTAAFGQPGTSYAMGIPVSETEPFPAFDSLGIQDPTGGMSYPNLGHPTLHGVEQYGSHQGSASPYSHSPHQGHTGQFYNP